MGQARAAHRIQCCAPESAVMWVLTLDDAVTRSPGLICYATDHSVAASVSGLGIPDAGASVPAQAGRQPIVWQGIKFRVSGIRKWLATAG